MTDPGYVIVWIDGDRDHTAAAEMIQQRLPFGYTLQWLNPRYFTDLSSAGLPPAQIRHHVLVTSDAQVRRAYRESGVAHLVLDDVPMRTQTPPDRVVIYAPAKDSDWLEMARARARQEFPGLSLLVQQVVDYRAPDSIPCRAVIYPSSHGRIGVDCARIRMPCAGIATEPVPSTGHPAWTLAASEVPVLPVVPDATLDATLDLAPGHLSAVLEGHTSTVFLSALRDREIRRGARRPVMDLLEARLVVLGGEPQRLPPVPDSPYLGQEYQAQQPPGLPVSPERIDPDNAGLGQEPAADSEPDQWDDGPPQTTPATKGSTAPQAIVGAAAALPIPPAQGSDLQHQAGIFVAVSGSLIKERLAFVDDASFLEAAIQAETKGEQRVTVVDALRKRIKAINEAATRAT